MTNTQLRQLIREEIKNVSKQDKYTSLQNIEKDLEDRISDFKQLDTPDELYEYLKMMINLLSPEVKDGENFKSAFRKMYFVVMKPEIDEMSSASVEIGDIVTVKKEYGGGQGKVVGVNPDGNFATVLVKGMKKSYNVADLVKK